MTDKMSVEELNKKSVKELLKEYKSAIQHLFFLEEEATEDLILQRVAELEKERDKWKDLFEKGCFNHNEHCPLWEYYAEQEKQISDLTEQINNPKSTFCAYCGFTVDIDDKYSSNISEHIKTCEKHPLNKIIKALQEQVESMKEANGYDDNGNPIKYGFK